MVVVAAQTYHAWSLNHQGFAATSSGGDHPLVFIIYPSDFGQEHALPQVPYCCHSSSVVWMIEMASCFKLEVS